MIKRLFLIGILCLFSAIYKPCYAEVNCEEVADAVEDGADADDFSDMYPYCDNIDSPVDDGVPFLIAAAVVFAIVKKYNDQNQLNEKTKLID